MSWGQEMTREDGDDDAGEGGRCHSSRSVSPPAGVAGGIRHDDNGLAIPTMGLSVSSPSLSGPTTYATPENEWGVLIESLIQEWMVPQSETATKWFYEGAPRGPAFRGRRG